MFSCLSRRLRSRHWSAQRHDAKKTSAPISSPKQTPVRMFRLPELAQPTDIGGVKRLTREQAEARKEKAVRFTDNVLDDPDRADEIADESLESYAERKGIEITNPHKRRNTVARTKTRAELQAEIEELHRKTRSFKNSSTLSPILCRQPTKMMMKARRTKIATRTDPRPALRAGDA
jgi:hypothetical protein